MPSNRIKTPNHVKKWQRNAEEREIRRNPNKLERTRLLIVCEGEKTEPNYFRALCKDYQQYLPENALEVIVEGTGRNTISLVEQAMRRKDDFDQVWVVFDKDDFPARNFNNAITIAESCGLYPAYSNEAFEYWYLLHFEYLVTCLSRESYGKKLSIYLGRKYQKNDTTLYTTIKSNTKQAVSWASQINKDHRGKDFAKHCPTTTVYRLIEALNKLKDKYTN